MAISISLSITQNSQNTADNSSNVTVKLTHSWTYGSWNHSSTTKYVTINGTKYSFNTAKLNPSKTTSGSATLFEKTLTIKHNSDGTGKVEASAYVNTDLSSGVLKKSATKTLTTIPRASTVSATSAVVGAQSTITISRKSSSFTHTLEYALGSDVGTITTKTTSTSVKWTLPTSFYAQIGASATSKSGTITCKTYSGSTLVGTKTCTFTAKTSSGTCAPTLSPTITADATTQGLTGNTTTLLKDFSTANVTFGAFARNGATISSRKVTNSGTYRTSDGVFSKITSGTFTFTTTDSRGYSTTSTKNVTLLNYFKPTCKLSVNIGVNGTAVIKINGTFFNASFGAKTNVLNIQYRYKISGGTYSSWINPANAAPSGDTYTANETLTGLNPNKTYYFQARAIDLTNNSATTGEQRITAQPVFDWGAADFNFNVPVTITSGSSSYNLLGMAKSMNTAYTMSCTTTLGTNYSSGSASAYLVGNNLRMYMVATRSSAVTTGNVVNETVMTININHGGKIKTLYRTGFANDTEGGLASFSAQGSAIDSDTMQVTVILTAAGYAGTSWNGYWSMPCTINLDAY